jgi:hypothetical protein
MADEDDQGLGASPQDPITKQGWMHKKGGHRRNWSKRWFVMKGAFLYYFSDEHDFLHGNPHKGVIPLKDVVTQIFFHRKRNFCFEVVHEERRTFYLQASTEEEKYEWIEAISAASAGPVNAPVTVQLYYDTLELPETASLIQIKKAYRKLALKNHPDRGGDLDAFKAVTEAYEVLCSVKETQVAEAEDYVEVHVTLDRGTRGLGISLEDSGAPPLNRVIVTGLIEGKPAHSSGEIRDQDTLIGVDGHGVRGIPFDDVLKFLKGTGSPTITLSFLRKKDGIGDEFDIHGVGKRKSMSEAMPSGGPWVPTDDSQGLVPAGPSPVGVEKRSKRKSWIARAEEAAMPAPAPYVMPSVNEDEEATAAAEAAISMPAPAPYAPPASMAAMPSDAGGGDASAVEAVRRQLDEAERRHQAEILALKAQLAAAEERAGLTPSQSARAAQAADLEAAARGSRRAGGPVGAGGKRPTRRAPKLPPSAAARASPSRGGAGGPHSLPREIAAQFTADELDKLKLTFQQFDRDHNGHITVDELAVMMQELHIAVDVGGNGDVLRQLVLEHDQDGNDTIEFTEFAALMLKMREGSANSAVTRAIGKAMGRVPTYSSTAHVVKDAQRGGGGGVGASQHMSFAAGLRGGGPSPSQIPRPRAGSGGSPAARGGGAALNKLRGAARTVQATAAVSSNFVDRIERLKKAREAQQGGGRLGPPRVAKTTGTVGGLQEDARLKLQRRLQYRPTRGDLAANDIIQDRPVSGRAS